MAPDVETVDQFLIELAEHAREPADKEIAELKAIAAQDGITRVTTVGCNLLFRKAQSSTV